METQAALTVDEVRREFEAYHETHFNEQACNLPVLDLLVSHGHQHSTVVVRKRSLSQAHLVLEILRRMAVERDCTFVLLVPYSVLAQHKHIDGFVRSPSGWLAVC